MEVNICPGCNRPIESCTGQFDLCINKKHITVKNGSDIFDAELYRHVLAIRLDIKILKREIERIECILIENNSKLDTYNHLVGTLEHVLFLDEYKEMNEDIEKDEKYESEIGE